VDRRPQCRGAKRDRRRVPDGGLRGRALHPDWQFVIPTAYRENLNGLIVAPVVFLWNAEKK
jgi:hypothetical protein